MVGEVITSTNQNSSNEVGPARRVISVLVVEDDRVNQVVIQHILQSLGASSSTAKNGQEAVAMVAQQAFDLILMDLQMPVMDGYEATRLIRQLSAQVSEKSRLQCMKSGMNDFMGKPLHRKILQTLLHRWVTG